MTKKLQKELNALLGEQVIIHKFNTRCAVFITGILRKAKNDNYLVAQEEAYVRFSSCRNIHPKNIEEGFDLATICI